MNIKTRTLTALLILIIGVKNESLARNLMIKCKASKNSNGDYINPDLEELEKYLLDPYFLQSKFPHKKFNVQKHLERHNGLYETLLYAEEYYDNY